MGTLPISQRWLNRATVFVKPGPWRPRRYEAAEISGDTTARAFVEQHHYSASYPAARRRVGLYECGDLVGVAVCSHPCANTVLTNVFPGTATDAAELGRVVLLDRVPFGAESWFLSECERLLSKQFRGLVAFSDPVRRTSTDGRVVLPGHVGTIYQASNAIFLGRATPRTLYLLPDGTVFHSYAAQKIRAQSRGWRYATEQLVSHGASEPTSDTRGWLAHWMRTLCRRVRHPGNLRYALPWNRNDRERLASIRQPYPKREAA
jgi:hypothetical protein